MASREKSKPYVLVTVVLICFTVVVYFSPHAENSFRSIITDNQPYQNIQQNQQGKHGMETKIQIEKSIKAEHKDAQPGITSGDIEARFQRRKQQMQRACSKYKHKLTYPHCEIRIAGFHYKYVNESDLVYCAIEKTGSTFWKRILHVIGGWGNDTNPTSIKSEDADSKHGGFETLKDSTVNVLRKILNVSASLMFVRDPFTRLFSAWLDKFYSPNPYYWSTTGPKIVKSERLLGDNITEHATLCASDISFTEFVNYTVKTITSRPCVDGHFAPNYRHCLPCLVPFDYVGKYETFKEDTFYLLYKLNLTNKVTFDDFERDAVWDTIRDTSKWVFSQKAKIQQCNVTFYCALYKLWNQMQSRGILSTKFDFPYTSVEEVQNIALDEFTGALLNASHESDPDETKNNRDEALEQAFHSLPDNLKDDFIDAFEIDFTMFEYERNRLFHNLSNQTTFVYFKECL